jgi:hypothetical protein
MTEKLKETTPYPNEWAYNCPYCNQLQGWCDYIDENEYERTHTCENPKCRKEFKLKKVKVTEQ